MVNADLSYLGGAIAFRQQRSTRPPRLRRRDRVGGPPLRGAFRSRRRGSHARGVAGGVGWLRRGVRVPECADASDRAPHRRCPRGAPGRGRACRARRAPRAGVADHHAQLGWARYNAGVAYANAGKPAEARARAAEAITIGGPARWRLSASCRNCRRRSDRGVWSCRTIPGLAVRATEPSDEVRRRHRPATQAMWQSLASAVGREVRQPVAADVVIEPRRLCCITARIAFGLVMPWPKPLYTIISTGTPRSSTPAAARTHWRWARADRSRHAG